ncbi:MULTISPECIES: Uma2 family endonuclease [unclassified Okeania]|uniref:Uma2 family endonuclease n=2 Tax=Okeania TaxID=1458928 RepID=UPI0013B8A642|nr:MULTISPECIES: Uma2 family endonuclease [unclassified Okeania]NES77298.1 Uma2 family endonuclease [Okeania sp. SIO1H4]NET15352.1 Uma2 family endonuclease [Okeania sp. SIO1H6]NET18132.1 Uma2 family endonuclease [Okeania sp. SIO1H5]NET93970.1 Uma2 family endonuclease [Okeania sp. SIO1H2]
MISKITTDETTVEIEEIAAPDISHLIIEDDTPVDNFQSEKQQRLVTTCLSDSWLGVDGSSRFLAAANIGVFYAVNKPALVPDVFLSLDVTIPEDWRERENRSYYTWEFGKAPDVVVEIVSNKVGNELGSKLAGYARIGVWYYVVFDPLQKLGESLLQVYELRANGYQQMTETWLEKVGLGLTLWSGEFEGKQDVWLRWCDVEGNVIPTGGERANQEKLEKELALQRAEKAEQKLAELETRLRELGIDPN